MITYEKIMKAHELSEKLGLDLLFGYSEDKNYSKIMSLDELVTDLGARYYHPPKYKKGQTIWYHIDTEIYHINISFIDYSVEDQGWMYQDDNGDEMSEAHAYPTLKALCDDQINYWTNLKMENN